MKKLGLALALVLAASPLRAQQERVTACPNGCVFRGGTYPGFVTNELRIQSDGSTPTIGGSPILTVAGSTPRLDQVLDPTADKTFNLGAHFLKFTGTVAVAGNAFVSTDSVLGWSDDAGATFLTWFEAGATGALEAFTNREGLYLYSFEASPTDFNRILIQAVEGGQALLVVQNENGGFTNDTNLLIAGSGLGGVTLARGTNTDGWHIGGTEDSDNLLPKSDNGEDLGSVGERVHDGFFGGTVHAAGYAAGISSGVSCSGSVCTITAVVNGIITACTCTP